MHADHVVTVGGGQPRADDPGPRVGELQLDRGVRRLRRRATEREGFRRAALLRVGHVDSDEVGADHLERAVAVLLDQRQVEGSERLLRPRTPHSARTSVSVPDSARVTRMIRKYAEVGSAWNNRLPTNQPTTSAGIATASTARLVAAYWPVIR